jgi:hypothetical protein
MSLVESTETDLQLKATLFTRPSRRQFHFLRICGAMGISNLLLALSWLECADSGSGLWLWDSQVMYLSPSAVQLCTENVLLWMARHLVGRLQLQRETLVLVVVVCMGRLKDGR